MRDWRLRGVLAYDCLMVLRKNSMEWMNEWMDGWMSSAGCGGGIEEPQPLFLPSRSSQSRVWSSWGAGSDGNRDTSSLGASWPPRLRGSWAQILASQFTSCVTLGQLLNLSLPYVPFVSCSDALWGLNEELTFVKEDFKIQEGEQEANLNILSWYELNKFESDCWLLGLGHCDYINVAQRSMNSFLKGSFRLLTHLELKVK